MAPLYSVRQYTHGAGSSLARCARAGGGGGCGCGASLPPAQLFQGWAPRRAPLLEWGGPVILKFPAHKHHRAPGSGEIAFALPVTSRRSSLITVEVAADAMRFITNSSPGRLTGARGRVYILRVCGAACVCV